MKFIKGLLAFILSCLLFVLIMIWCTMGSTKNIFSEGSINKLFKNIDMTEILNNEYGDKIYSVLDEIGIPKDYVNDVLNNEELKEMASSYIYEMVSYIAEPKEVPQINADELSAVLQESFDKAVSEFDKYTDDMDSEKVNQIKEQITDERKEEVKRKIDEYTPKIIESLPTTEELVNQLNQNEQISEGMQTIDDLRAKFKTVKRIYSYHPLALLSIFVVIGLIIALCFKKFKYIKWIMWPFILCTTIFKLFIYFSNYIVDKILFEHTILPKTTIKNITNQILDNFAFYGNICLIISILLFVVLIVIIILNKHNRKKVEDPII